MVKHITNNPVKKALLERKPTLGSWIQMGHPAVAEIMANVGFEWLAVDCEHTDIGLNDFTNLARGMYGRGSVPLVRVRENDTLAIRQVLDAGAQGVIVPLIHSAQEAANAVAAAKYPPVGKRGFCFSRMNEYGENFDEYAEHANDNIIVIAMIESKEAVQNIQDILAVDGIDGIFVGPYDLSGSIDMPGQLNSSTMNGAIDRILNACKSANKSAGIHVVAPDEKTIIKTLDMGFTFVALSVDILFMNKCARQSLEIAHTAIENSKKTKTLSISS